MIRWRNILTASHNPKQWNALKLLNHKGEFLDAKEGQKILHIAENENINFSEVDDLGKITSNQAYIDLHIDEILDLPLVDVEAIKKQIPEVQFVVPRNVQGVFGGPPASVKRKTNTKTYKLFGDYPILDNVNKVKIIDGRFINVNDINSERKVCIIGEKIVDELFKKDEKPVGDFLEINGSFFQVVGTYKDNGTSFEGDDSIYIPFSTYRKINNTGENIGWMVIAASKDANIVEVEKNAKAILKRRHNVHPDDERAFGSFNFGEMFGKITGFVTGIKFLTWFVGISTLIAGVIAIGSILLITVKERTKEIGIRRAVGATPAKIRGQIVLESVFLTILAGVIGIPFDKLESMIVNATLSDLPQLGKDILKGQVQGRVVINNYIVIL